MLHCYQDVRQPLLGMGTLETYFVHHQGLQTANEIQIRNRVIKILLLEILKTELTEESEYYSIAIIMRGNF